MLATSHFIATTGILLLAKKIGLNVSLEIVILTYLLGNGIDIDHIIVYPKKSLIAAKNFLKGRKAEYGKVRLHSYLQEPWFAITVLLVSLAIFVFLKRVAIFLPGFALSIHILIDALTKFDNYLFWPFSKKSFNGFIPSNSKLEYILSIVLAILIFYIALKNKIFIL